MTNITKEKQSHRCRGQIVARGGKGRGMSEIVEGNKRYKLAVIK